MNLDILVICAHPDDAELGCGGTIMKAIDAGYKVGIIDLTEGEMGTRGTAETRKSEAEEAANIMGIHLRENLGFSDGLFDNDHNHRIEVIKKIRKHTPSLIITNAPDDRHPDHGRAAQMVKHAAWISGLKKLQTVDEDGEFQVAHRPEHVYHIIQYKLLTPSVVVNVDGYMDRKMKAILAYKTQFFNSNNPDEATTLISKPEFLNMVKSRMYSDGNLGLVDYGEAFITDFVPVVDNIMQLIPKHKILTL